MIRLIGAELNRLASRRLSLVLAAAVVVVVALFQVAVAQAVAPPSAAQVAVARQGFEQDRQQWQQNHEQWQQQCLDQGGSEAECVIPEPSEADYGLAPTPYGDIVGAGVTFAVVMAMLAAYVISASFMGAEYSTGSLGNWLTFVPRRERVYAAKVVALVIGSGALGALAGLLMVGGAAIVTSVQGQPLTGIGGVTAAAARGVPVVVFAALMGFGIALLTRHTVAALGALLGYGLLVLGLSIVSYLVPVLSLLKRWQLETNILAFVNHGHAYQVVERVISAEGVSLQAASRTLAFAPAGTYLAAVLVVMLAIALLVFRGRDVT
ncbi:MAG TPA: hypothetical protein VFP34_17785 [Microlunatus sp.]|nr:hypothetical protein [Microlunatus sp.]